ncbi:DUF2875 family protein, partial [Pseudomonas syringae]
LAKPNPHFLLGGVCGADTVVYAGTDGSLTVQMVRPPDEARKAKNSQNRGADPFTYGSP